MAAALAALRGRSADLMRTMEVFLNEPLIDWDTQAKKLSEEQRSALEGSAPPGASAAADANTTQPDDWTQGGGGGGGGGGGSGGGGGTRVVGATVGSTGGGATAVGGATGGLLSQWSRQRVEGARAKLEGAHPAKLTVKEIGMSVIPKVRECAADIARVVMGPEGSLRRELAEQSAPLTVEQQVDLLVEQATDPNILGRTYIGWAPWL